VKPVVASGMVIAEPPASIWRVRRLASLSETSSTLARRNTSEGVSRPEFWRPG
jgi:hypothetical protein